MHSNLTQRGVAPIIPIIIIVAIIGGAVWFATSQGGSSEPVVETETMMEKTEDTMMEKPEEVMMEKETGDTAMMQKGGYEAYAPEKLAFSKTGKTVLFFHAPWCPYCRAADASLNEELAAIPADLLILKTDYDSQTALKQKYGVTYQHTFVQVDAEGNQLAKWSGSENLADIVAKLK